jgi:hypothetical protein
MALVIGQAKAPMRTDFYVYKHKGKFIHVDRQLNSKTGTSFPNPELTLRPGQYAMRADSGDSSECTRNPGRKHRSLATAWWRRANRQVTHT